MIHLHIQAKDRFGNAISPDLAFRVGQRKLETPVKLQAPESAEFDPDLWTGVDPVILDGVVKCNRIPKSKWVVELIGGGGRVDAVLGEFYTLRDAWYCSSKWHEAHPDDLRLTREREVKLDNRGKRRAEEGRQLLLP